MPTHSMEYIHRGLLSVTRYCHQEPLPDSVINNQGITDRLLPSF